MQDLIINFAPTGMVPTTAQNPSVPVDPLRIIEEVLEAGELGANIAHLHARDGDERPSADPVIYERIIRGIRAHNAEIIICVSTSGRIDPSLESRSAVLNLNGDAKPDMASLTLSSLNFARSASLNCPDTIRGLAEKMSDVGIKPELEVFDLGMINYGNYLIQKGVLKPPFYFNLLFGNIAGMQSDYLSMGHAVGALPHNATWAFAGIGDYQLSTTSAAIAMGGHVRIGLEDNLYFDRESAKLATNSMLLSRVLNMAQAMGRRLASTKDVRAQLGLSSTSDDS